MFLVKKNHHVQMPGGESNRTHLKVLKELAEMGAVLAERMDERHG